LQVFGEDFLVNVPNSIEAQFEGKEDRKIKQYKPEEIDPHKEAKE